MGTKTDPYRILDTHDWTWGLCLVAFLWLTPLGTLGGGVILATNELPQVNFIAVPQDFQLVPRDPSTNTASVRIAGMVLDPGYDVIRARVYREGALYGPDHLIALEYVNGVAPFCTRTSIVAELADYAFEVYIAQGTNEIMIASAENVVGGDVFIQNGQSNARATQRPGEPSINDLVIHTNNWLRSFGTREDDPSLLILDQSWHLASGDNEEGSGEIGQWALRAAKLLSDQQQLPIAIISQASGGAGIDDFLRNDANPGDLTSNYGRLLWRCTQAGVSDHVRGVFWYQGEYDAEGDPLAYEASMDVLYESWLEEYTAIERVYVHQLKIGCGTLLRADLTFRDMQRRWANQTPGVQIMSGTAVSLYSDGCHTDTAANLELGLNLQRIISCELYGAQPQPDIYPPDIDVAYFSTASSNEIVMRNRWVGDHLNLDSGAEHDFVLHGPAVPAVWSATTDGNVIRIFLSGPGTAVNSLSYTANADWPNAGPDIKNDGGIGLLAFAGLAVDPYSPPAPSGDGDQDGLPNAWEDMYFGNVFEGQPDSDNDGDGAINMAEFMAGTDPNNSTSVFCVTAFTLNGHDSLEFVSSSQRTYTIQFSTDLSAGFWTDIRSGFQGKYGTTIVTNLSAAPGSGFYRVLLDQP